MKRLLILSICLIVAFLFFGCSKKDKDLPYNAELYFYGIVELFPYEEDLGRFKRSFLDENRISGVNFKNPDYNPLDPNSKEYITDSTLPRRRMHIVNSKKEFDVIFETKCNVDFDNHMLIVFIFSDTNNRYKLDDVILNDKDLEIRYLIENIDTTMPNRKAIVVEMDKMDVDNIEFKCNGRFKTFNISWRCILR